MKKETGITLIALIITIIVLLILAGVSISMVVGDNGILSQAVNASETTEIASEKEQIEVAYLSAMAGNPGESVTESSLQAELDKVATTYVTDNGDDTFNVLFSDTGHNYNVNNGTVTRVNDEDYSKIAIFDTGMNVLQKIASIIPSDGILTASGYPFMLSIDGIKKYTGTPDLTQMTDANIVSLEEAPSEFSSIISEETELCTIYIWFEESENQKYRDIGGRIYEGTDYEDFDSAKTVTTGTLYWWCESNNVYLNPDSSYMFAMMPYLSDISGLSRLKTDYVTNISYMFWAFCNQESLQNVNALANWNTSNVTNMSNLFSGCTSLTDISGLANWDTSNVTDMSYLFGDCVDMLYCGLSDITPISNWNVSNVNNMEGMFNACQITNLDALKTWNVSSVSNMKRMFYDCTCLEDTSGINDWDVTNVTDFTNMFIGADESLYPTFTKVSGTWDSDGTFTKN